MSAISSLQVTPSTKSESRIEDILTSLPELWNRHDIAAYVSHFSKDVDFVNVLGGYTRGRAALQAELVAIHQTIFRNSRLEIIEIRLRFLTPDIALAHVVWQMTGHENPAVKQWQSVRKGIFSAVLMPEEDTWRIRSLQNTDVVPMPGK